MPAIKEIARFPAGAAYMPPSKSVAHRALICAALSGKDGHVVGTGASEDIEATRRCLRSLATGEEPLDCGESGSTLRFLIPLAALSDGQTIFTGASQLLARPLSPYLDALSTHGMNYTRGVDRLTVSGPLRPGIYTLPGDVSSQYVSGLLMALPLLDGDSEIRLTSPLASAPYAGLTLDMLSRFGVHVQAIGTDQFIVPGRQTFTPATVHVEGDFSQAAFFLVAGALGFPCECLGLLPDSRQGDRAIVDILRRAGSSVEPTAGGGLIARPGPLMGLTVDVTDTPDLAPPLAALLCCCEGPSRITGAGRLRHKESDRLFSIPEALGSLGANIRADGDSLVIQGMPFLRGGCVNPHGDHRIAMMTALAAIRCRQAVYLTDSHCVAKSYPDFWRDFEKIGKEEPL